MSRDPDARGWSHYSAFLSHLPDGTRSYPEAQAKASMLHELARQLPVGFPMDDLPAPVREVLISPPPVSQWLNEAEVCAVSMAIRDVGFSSDEEYLQWIETGFTTFFSSPLYRVLMSVASPASLSRGAHRRWSALRRGTSRKAFETFANGNRARVEFPEYLCTRLYAESAVRGIQVAYRMSRARDPRTTILEYTPRYYITETIYDQSRPIEG